MADLKHLAEQINALSRQGEHAFFLGPIPEGRVASAERDLGVRMTGSFRAYLLHLGAAFMLGQDIAGLPGEIQSDEADWFFLSIVDVTRECRRFMEDLPSSYVFITDNGGWITFWVDTAGERVGEAPVVAYSYEKLVPISDSFLGFVDLLTHPEDLYKRFA